MRISVFFLIFLLQFPYGGVSFLGSVFLMDRIEINSITEWDLDLLEEMEETGKGIDYRDDWFDQDQYFSNEEVFKLKSIFFDLCLPHECTFLPNIPPETSFFS
ncbi:hypothetical protein SAMN03080617_01460 [Algoriphagus alkaliphilus]|uniref:Uncharacterized protein n=1 Tax=Algoriphagus alkaliphilus TaxID=279824 RepID=A0A1G5WZY0_9BACT|nr:hypothetical protein [Algoriphagus alkaliphilus]SDA63719.1 hypothetical protein SAMN03080617_01460 [Algoriphagus alkaliphilus]